MKPQSILAVFVAVALLAAGCGRSGSSGDQPPTKAAQPVSGDFGDLKSVCKPGTATSAPAQGVTAKQIKVAVFTDMGFTKNPELVNAAKVFTAWCNAAGGIGGRKLVADIRDTNLMNVRPPMLQSCREDFATVAGSAGFDGLAVKDRLNCLLPDFPAQVVQAENNGSGLQVYAGGNSSGYNDYQGEYQWLLKDAYPASANAVGIIYGDAPVTKIDDAQAVEGFKAAGAKVVYNDVYPVQGVSDWMPYAQAIKSKRVKGLLFYGDFLQLVKLEQVLTGIDYKLDWIDPNNNSYSPIFLQLAGKSIGFQNNVVGLTGVAPLESASSVPAIKQIQNLYATYAPQAHLTFPTLRAFSAWLLFAKSAESCGDNLTRACVYKAASSETAWAGGGLQSPADLTKNAPQRCFNIEQATPQGWKPADFKPDTGPYRCDAPAYKLKGNYPKPVTLADVGKSLSALK